MKRFGLLVAAVLVALPGSATALCYTVFGPNQVVIWRGTNTPIDLSKPIHEGMRQMFPAGNFLVIEDGRESCTPIGPQDYFGPMPGLTGPVPGVPGMQGGMTAAPGKKR